VPDADVRKNSKAEKIQQQVMEQRQQASKTKTPEEYAKELEQWLKKMKCTGVTGIRLESFADIKVGILDDNVDHNAISIEPYPNIWKEKHKYKGYNDENGKPRGKAVIEFENGDCISGSFQEGLRHGECRIEIASENAAKRKNLAYLIGNYVKDQLHGKCKAGFSNGDWYEGYFCRGIAHGFFRQFDEKGRLTKIGYKKDGLWNGVCWKVVRGSGVIVGRVNKAGEMTGMRIAYLYPDYITALVGSFEKGQMESARPTTLKTVVDDRGLKIPIFAEPTGPSYIREISNYTHVTSNPTYPDPYESRIVQVRFSNVEGANEGLFARLKIEPNTILSFYNGIRLDPKKAIDMPKWEDNAYRIFDPTRRDGTIDIPTEFISSANYCASLAHKTNHSFLPNAEFVAFDHPRFGLVPCLLSTHDIEKDEEIFVHYGYELSDSPEWYEAAWSSGNYPVPKSFKEWYVIEDKKNGIPIKDELFAETDYRKEIDYHVGPLSSLSSSKSKTNNNIEE